MQSCSESHQCQVDRRHKERLRIQILKAGEKEQAVLAGGDKTKHSVVSGTQRGETWSQSEQNSGVNSEKSAMAGCYAGRQEIFSGNKKRQKTKELLERELAMASMPNIFYGQSKAR